MYLEPIINEELKPYGLSVVWDGNYPEPGEDVCFYVCYGDDETDFVLRHGRGSTDVYEYLGNCRYGLHGYATNFTELAPLLAEIVRDTHVAA